jgi:hypothetical protein
MSSGNMPCVRTGRKENVECHRGRELNRRYREITGEKGQDGGNKKR